MLPRVRPPRDAEEAIKARQLEFRTRPETRIGRLSHRVDVTQVEPALADPSGVRILTDIEGWL